MVINKIFLITFVLCVTIQTLKLIGSERNEPLRCIKGNQTTILAAQKANRILFQQRLSPIDVPRYKGEWPKEFYANPNELNGACIKKQNPLVAYAAIAVSAVIFVRVLWISKK